MASYLIAGLATAVLGGAIGAYIGGPEMIALKTPDPVAAWTELAHVQADADGGRLDCLKGDEAEWRKFFFSDFAVRTARLHDEAIRAGLSTEAAATIEAAYIDRLGQAAAPCNLEAVERNEEQAARLWKSVSGSSSAG